MSREVKRVPLDFKLGLKEIWPGYLMPEELHPTPCHACDQSGYSPEAKVLSDQWYGRSPFIPALRGSEPLTVNTPAVRRFAERNVRRSPEYYGWYTVEKVDHEARRLAEIWNGQWSHHLNQDDVDALVARDRLCDLTSKWEQGKGWVKTGHHPTAQEVNEWAINSWGHDAINQWIVVGAEIERQGIPKHCAKCHGEGAIYKDERHRQAYENWESSGPPEGDGWQMWETVTEGSPISPVFETPEELATWLADNKATTFGSDTTDYETWFKMICVGHSVGSAVVVNGVYKSGVQDAADNI